MAAVKGFLLTFPLAAFAFVVALSLGVSLPHAGKSASQPAPAPTTWAGHTIAFI